MAAPGNEIALSSMFSERPFATEPNWAIYSCCILQILWEIVFGYEDRTFVTILLLNHLYLFLLSFFPPSSPHLFNLRRVMAPPKPVPIKDLKEFNDYILLKCPTLSSAPKAILPELQHLLPKLQILLCYNSIDTTARNCDIFEMTFAFETLLSLALQAAAGKLTGNEYVFYLFKIMHTDVDYSLDSKSSYTT